MILYPFLFEPTFHYRIWGGNKLKKYSKNIVGTHIGESWEISTIPNYVSVVSNGLLKGKNLNELVKEYGTDLVGTKVYDKYGDQFPLLIKFLDAASPLSVQVHPDDEYAQKYYNSFGKTEMWYVLEAEEGSEIVLGFEKGVDEKKYSEILQNGSIETILRKVHPQKEDVVYIPAGRVHAMGSGISVVEIQQTSDITFRIYDYDRVDKDGKKRELHTQKAKEVSDFSFIEEPLVSYDKNSKKAEIIKSPYFSALRFIISEDTELEVTPESFKILICTEGECILQTKEKSITISTGQSVLIPANMENILIKPKVKTLLLEVHID